MVLKLSLRWQVAVCVAALMMALPASADIKTFNGHVTAGNYKAAAAEAAATWPTLDKSRKDIALIAREFGFAAFVAKDFAAARTFAQAALDAEANDPAAAQSRTASMILLRLAEHRAAPTQQTRDNLLAAETARGAFPGIDNISYLGLDSVVAFDFEKGAWKNAQATTELAMRMSFDGGAPFLIYHRRFALFNAVASYMVKEDVLVYDKLQKLKDAMIADINAAPSDESAMTHVAFYWEVSAWANSIGTHLVGERKMEWPDREDQKYPKPTERMMRLLSSTDPDAACVSQIDMRKKPSYPSSALYKRLIGTVIIQVEVDEKGQAKNGKILASVPEQYFGEPVMKSVPDIRYKPGPKWNSSCSLAEKSRIVTFQFQIG